LETAIIPDCGGRLKVVAFIDFIDAPQTIRRIPGASQALARGSR
jgi:hypothetical protein